MHTELAIEPDRVRRNTPREINRRIDAATVRSIRYYATQPAETIDRRINELNREWDLDRVLQTHGALLALGGLRLGATLGKRWLLLSGAVLGALLQHGTAGWCPPMPFLRRAGVRTRTEIDREKLALKYLRGDFREPEPPSPVRRRLGALVE